MSLLTIILITAVVLAVLIYFGLPRVLQTFGLHGHYEEIPPYRIEGKRALIITTSQSTLGESGKATGVFGSEMTVPYYALFPMQGSRSISGRSREEKFRSNRDRWDGRWERPPDFRFKKDRAAMAKMNDSIPLANVDITQYNAIFLAGGWGAAYDFAQVLAELVTAANADGDVIGSVCHGALGLVHARDTDGSPLIEGRRVTGVTDTQIRLGISATPQTPGD